MHAHQNAARDTHSLCITTGRRSQGGTGQAVPLPIPRLDDVHWRLPLADPDFIDQGRGSRDVGRMEERVLDAPRYLEEQVPGAIRLVPYLCVRPRCYQLLSSHCLLIDSLIDRSLTIAILLTPLQSSQVVIVLVLLWHTIPTLHLFVHVGYQEQSV